MPFAAQPMGGYPFADNKTCFAGSVYLLRIALRKNGMPDSSLQCHLLATLRPLDQTFFWPNLVLIFDELRTLGLLDPSELAIEATFAEARIRGLHRSHKMRRRREGRTRRGGEVRHPGRHGHEFGRRVGDRVQIGRAGVYRRGLDAITLAPSWWTGPTTATCFWSNSPPGVSSL